jgi:hypothetical protein
VKVSLFMVDMIMYLDYRKESKKNITMNKWAVTL